MAGTESEQAANSGLECEPMETIPWDPSRLELQSSHGQLRRAILSLAHESAARSRVPGVSDCQLSMILREFGTTRSRARRQNIRVHNRVRLKCASGVSDTMDSLEPDYLSGLQVRGVHPCNFDFNSSPYGDTGVCQLGALTRFGRTPRRLRRG